ncbi:hypothetical protein CRE_30744 [Caenorhabditis remanei]|uniref:F-box domain-containing protein n=1 Tax=Caenorhabditis remanei TaxID=31234 RepID=E3LU23_CAERE|nr:hypothetical protein CRE_30744 [Caenorhabditis remanei]
MKLLTLPSVVQRNVFELLGFKQLLIISFCSKRTRYLIQSLQKYRWIDIKFVKYSFEEEDKIYVNVRSENINEGFILSPNTLEQLVITPMDVFGMGSEIPICLHPIYYGGRYIYDKEQTQIVVQGIHDYLYQFFGSSIDYEVESIEDQPPANSKKHQ